MLDLSMPTVPKHMGIGASVGRVAGLSRRIIRQLAADHRTLGFVVVAPALIMTLLYFLTTITPAPPVVAVQAPAAKDLPAVAAWQQAVITALQKTGRVEASPLSPAYEGEPAKAVADGQAYAVVILPSPSPAGGQAVQIVVDGSDPTATQTVLAALGQTMAALPGQQSAASPPVSVAVQYMHAAGFKLMDFFAPIFIPFFVFFFTFLLTVVSFLRERTGGTMERLFASPIGAAEIILGYLGGFLVFALIESLIVLFFTIYVLKIHYQGSLASIFVVEVFLTVLGVNLGIFLSTYAKNELQAVQFIPVVIIPQALLAETFWKVADMPWLLRELAFAMPLTYSNLALKDIMLRGKSLGDVSVYLLALGAYTLVTVGLSAVAVRRARY